MCFAAWSAGHGEYVRCVHDYTSRALSHSFSFKLLYLYTVCYLLCLLLIWLILEKHNLIFVVLLCWYNKMTIKLWLIDWLIDCPWWPAACASSFSPWPPRYAPKQSRYRASLPNEYVKSRSVAGLDAIPPTNSCKENCTGNNRFIKAGKLFSRVGNALASARFVCSGLL